MDKARIQSVHEDSWGKATIFAPRTESEAALVVTPKSILQLKMKDKSMSRVKSSSERFDHSSEILRDKSEKDIDNQSDLLEIDLRHVAPDGTGLSRFEACLLETVLEDTIIQLRILVECNNEMRYIKTLSDYLLLEALKYGVEQPVMVDELAGINPYDLDKLEYKLNKLDNDRNCLADLFTKMYVSLSIDGSYAILHEHVFEIIDKERRYDQLREDEAKNRIIKRELAKQLRQQKIHQKTLEYDSNVLMDTLKTAIEDADLFFEISKRYVGKWQGARTECHQLIIHRDESIYTDSTEYYKRRTDHEQRVHAEVELLTNILINETLQKVEDWMNKYEEDMEAMDLKTQIKRLEYQEMFEKRVYLEDKHGKHEVEMAQWIKFKEERAARNAYQDTMNKSAIIVQAWWRGLLVRKELGPFRVTKKKKGGPKK